MNDKNAFDENHEYSERYSVDMLIKAADELNDYEAAAKAISLLAEKKYRMCFIIQTPANRSSAPWAEFPLTIAQKRVFV